MFIGEATNTNFIVFGLTQSGLVSYFRNIIQNGEDDSPEIKLIDEVLNGLPLLLNNSGQNGQCSTPVSTPPGTPSGQRKSEKKKKGSLPVFSGVQSLVFCVVFVDKVHSQFLVGFNL
jgi:hypothetical protein